MVTVAPNAIGLLQFGPGLVRRVEHCSGIGGHVVCEQCGDPTRQEEYWMPTIAVGSGDAAVQSGSMVMALW